MKKCLLICGQFRDKSNIESLNSLITNDMDVFISSWNKYGKRHSKSKLTNIHERFCDNQSTLLEKDINKIKNIVSINIEELEMYTKYNFIHESIIKKCGSKHSPIGTVYNIYHINKCLDLMKLYEIKTNINYDYIIKIRPDLIFDKSCLDNFNVQNKIYFSSNTSNVYAKSDKFFLAKKNIFVNFIEKINEYSKYIWKNDFTNINDEKIYPIGERLFNQIIKYYNLDYKILNDKRTYISNIN